MPDCPKSPPTLHTKVDYQAAGLGSNQIGKESEYTFAKLSSVENYKEWAREMIFASEDLRLLGYVDDTITRPPLLATEENESTVTISVEAR